MGLFVSSAITSPFLVYASEFQIYLLLNKEEGIEMVDLALSQNPLVLHVCLSKFLDLSKCCFLL